MTFSIDQVDSRQIKGDSSKYNYSYFRLTIGQVTKSGFKYVESVLSNKRNIFTNLTLPAGRYVALIDGYWVSEATKQFTFSSYSTGAITMHELIKLPNDLYDSV